MAFTPTQAPRSATPQQDAHGSGRIQPNYTPALTALTVLFFMMGFITCLNDILIPYLRLIFSLNYTQGMLINTCFFGAYFFMSIPSGSIIQKVGYKKGMILGFLTAAVACVLFYPAAETKSYGLFLLALFILATGITLLQVAGNPYVAVLGKPETASARLTLTQAFNSLGTTLAPLLGSYLILSHLPTITEGIDPSTINPHAVQMPYLGIAGVLLVISILMAFFKLPVINPGEDDADNSTTAVGPTYNSAWNAKHLILGALGIFCYVGAEVSIGSFLVNFLGLESVMSMPEKVAGNYVSYYWGGAMIGRFIGAYALQKLKPSLVLAFNAVAAIALVLVAMFTSGEVAMWAILGVGFFNSVMFSCIFTLALVGLGRHTNQGSGILCTAIVGGAIVPLLQGVIADSSDLHLAFIIPVICYIYIVYYGLRGHRVSKR